MGSASKLLLIGVILLVAAAAGLLDREFASPPPTPADPPPPMEDLSHLADAPPAATLAYRVRKGDTLEGIARRVYGEAGASERIRDARHQVPRTIRQGQTLLLPGPPPVIRSRPYVVREGDSLYKIAARVLGDGDRWRVIYEANRDTLPSPMSLHEGQILRILDDL